LHVPPDTQIIQYYYAGEQGGRLSWEQEAVLIEAEQYGAVLRVLRIVEHLRAFLKALRIVGNRAVVLKVASGSRS